MLSHFVVLNGESQEVDAHFSYFSQVKLFGLVERKINSKTAGKIKPGNKLKFIGNKDVFYNQAFLSLYDLKVGEKYEIKSVKNNFPATM